GETVQRTVRGGTRLCRARNVHARTDRHRRATRLPARRPRVAQCAPMCRVALDGVGGQPTPAPRPTGCRGASRRTGPASLPSTAHWRTPITESGGGATAARAYFLDPLVLTVSAHLWPSATIQTRIPQIDVERSMAQGSQSSEGSRSDGRI